MTIPWMMNCEHVESGWCLNCVKALGDEAAGYRERIPQLQMLIVSLVAKVGAEKLAEMISETPVVVPILAEVMKEAEDLLNRVFSRADGGKPLNMTRREVPWTAEEVKSLEGFQAADGFHPFTCGGTRGDADHTEHAAKHGEDRGQLVPLQSGWRCPVPGCDYRQDWAYEFMLDGTWRRLDTSAPVPAPV